MKIIHLILLLFLCGTAFAQQGTSNKLDDQYVPGDKSIFASGKAANSGKSNDVLEMKNSIKVNPTLLTRSIAAIFYERLLGKFLSLQAGLGYCYAKDWVQVLFSTTVSDFGSSNTTQLKMSDLVSQGTYTSGNIFYALSLRYYFNEFTYGESNFYMDLGIWHSSYSLTLPTNINDNQISGYPIVTIRNFNTNLTFGYQFASDHRRLKAVHNLYTGFGMRITSFEGFNSVTDPTDPSRNIFQLSGYLQKTIAPVFLFGYSLGIGF